MSKIENLFVTAAIPLMLVNTFGGVFSLIWLAILGEWGIIGTGVLAMLASGMTLGLAMMPGLIFAVPASTMLENGNKIGSYICGFLSLMYTYGLLIVWSVFVMTYFTNQASESSLVPVLFWSYSVATGAISFLTSKDIQGGNDSSILPTFLIQIAYLAVIIGTIFIGGMTLFSVICLFILIMSIGFLGQMADIFQFSSAHEK